MGLNSQVVFSPAYNNYDDLYKDLVDHPHVSFISSNWSNYELNQNLNLLEGAKCIKVTGGRLMVKVERNLSMDLLGSLLLFIKLDHRILLVILTVLSMRKLMYLLWIILKSIIRFRFRKLLKIINNWKNEKYEN